MQKVEAALAAAGPDDGRDAHFTCALSLAWPDGQTESFEGKVFGHLVWPPRGANGFGYDPAFLPHGYQQTFGEMAPEAKHAMSHRAKAFEQLVQWLES
jgi:XTP/dITP diphosphohydrolase